MPLLERSLQHRGKSTTRHSLILRRIFSVKRDSWWNSLRHKQSPGYWRDMIYLFTASGLTPGRSSRVHIHTQSIHRTTQSTQTVHRTTQHNNISNYSTDWTIEGIGVRFLAGINIEGDSGGKVSVLGGGSIGHCVKRKYVWTCVCVCVCVCGCVCVCVSYSKWLPRWSCLNLQVQSIVNDSK